MPPAGEEAVQPLDANFPLVLVVGAQRSGTTWLQQLLSAHPQIAAGYESNLFSKYLKDAWALWWTEEADRRQHGGTKGLAAYVTIDEWAGLLASVASRVFRNVLNAKPGAVLVAEKTPDHALYLRMVRWLFPTVRVIHMVRDARDVVASVLDASARPWGEGWAPSDAGAAAEMWVQWVTAARQDAGAWRDFHLEVHYESLAAAGPSTLDRIFRFLGVPLAAGPTSDIYDMFSFDRVRAGTAPKTEIFAGELRRELEQAAGSTDPSDLDKLAAAGRPPEGFYRQGRVGGWRDALSETQVQAVLNVAGTLLGELGYGESASDAVLCADPLGGLHETLDEHAQDASHTTPAGEKAGKPFRRPASSSPAHDCQAG
jgi:hypothetical protein